MPSLLSPSLSSTPQPHRSPLSSSLPSQPKVSRKPLPTPFAEPEGTVFQRPAAVKSLTTMGPSTEERIGLIKKKFKERDNKKFEEIKCEKVPAKGVKQLRFYLLEDDPLLGMSGDLIRFGLEGAK
jgi:hypothetical protein